MTFKEIQKAIKWCKKQGINELKTADFQFSMTEKPVKAIKSKKNSDKIEGLIHDPAAAMPPDSEMLYYSTQTFDSIRNSRKDPTPRN
jgi:hypothetical protein